MPRRKITEESPKETAAPRARKPRARSGRREGADAAPEAAPKPRRSTRATKSAAAPSIAPREVQLAEPKATSAATPDAIRERAYLLAERNGFAGDPAFYWMLAERELSAEA